jgi:SAM-dependent methyltransferase
MRLKFLKNQLHSDFCKRLNEERILGKTLTLGPGLEAGGAPVMWERAVREAMPKMRELLPAGNRIMEVGYGDGLLTAYLCQELGWWVVGLEVNREEQRRAAKHAKEYGLSHCLDFRCEEPEKVFQHQGQYDGVFIKTVLYMSDSLEEYGRRLDWIFSVLRPGGVFINFETGRANALTQRYRHLRRRSYTNLCLYTRQVEALYDARFDIIERRYYGGFSQFLAPAPWLYFLAARLEEKLRPRHADNCFIASIIARRPLYPPSAKTNRKNSFLTSSIIS